MKKTLILQHTQANHICEWKNALLNICKPNIRILYLLLRLFINYIKIFI